MLDRQQGIFGRWVDMARRSLGLDAGGPESDPRLRPRRVLIATFCFVGVLVAALSLPLASNGAEVAFLWAFLLAAGAVPFGARLGVPEWMVPWAGMALLFGFLVAMSLVPETQQAQQLFWLAVLPLAGGLLLGGAGIAGGGLLALSGGAAVTLAYPQAVRVSGPVLVDAGLFVASVAAMVAMYERLYAREQRRVGAMLRSEADSRRALARSERELRTILDADPACVQQIGRDRRLIHVNAAGLRLMRAGSVDAVRGVDVLELVPTDHRDAFRRAVDAVFAGRRTQDVLRVEFPAGASWTELHGAPLFDDQGEVRSMLAIYRDITAQMGAEQERLRKNRVEAIGNLASGIAHDLNNVLTPIRLGLEELRGGDEDDETIGMMESGLEHAASMVRQLVDFAKGTEAARRSVEVEPLIRETVGLLQSTLPKRIRVELACAPDLPPVPADPTQIHQVLLNLCVNARDAMPDGGRLRIEAESARVEQPEGVGADAAQPGPYMVIRVRDEGVGIAPERMPAVFDPFYTTKSPQKGTGLGLSTVLGIVRGHGGFLSVRSASGVGTTVAVHLPLGAAPKAVERPASLPVARASAERCRVLLVDDDEMIVKLVARILRSRGCVVETAPDGTAAWARVEASGLPDAVVTDLHMPGLDGLGLLERLRARVPELPALLMSGRLSDFDGAPVRSVPGLVMLQKPFGRSELLEAFERALRTGSASGGEVS